MWRCLECGRHAHGDTGGWMVVPLMETGEPGDLVLLAYCPACVAKELDEVESSSAGS